MAERTEVGIEGGREELRARLTGQVDIWEERIQNKDKPREEHWGDVMDVVIGWAVWKHALAGARGYSERGVGVWRV